MKSKAVLAISLSFLSVFAVSCQSPTRAIQRLPQGSVERRPNILLVFTDDQTYRSVSAYRSFGGHQWVNTPNMDALAKAGVLFTHGYVGTWCGPARATTVTGLQPFGIESLRFRIPYPAGDFDARKFRSWTVDFREAGYTAGQIGKWHIGETDGSKHGWWDHQVVWNRPRYPSNAKNYYQDQFISVFNSTPGRQTVTIDRIDIPGYTTHNYTQWAIDFIRNTATTTPGIAPGSVIRDASKPWYLWVAYSAPHGPFTPFSEDLLGYTSSATQKAILAELPYGIVSGSERAGKPRYIQELDNWTQGAKEPEAGYRAPDLKVRRRSFTAWMAQYQQTVTALDRGLGEIIEALKETDQLENTLIVFTSDQGFAWGQYGLLNKFAPYDDAIKPPLIVSFRGRIPANQVRHSPVGIVDLIPTFFDYAGIAPRSLEYFHGKSIRSLIEGGDKNYDGRPAILVYTGDRFGSDILKFNPVRDTAHGWFISKASHGVPWWISAVMRINGINYKYVHYLRLKKGGQQANEDELFDLREIPVEKTNLVDKPEHRGVLVRMRQGLLDEVSRTGPAPFAEMLRESLSRQ